MNACIGHFDCVFEIHDELNEITIRGKLLSHHVVELCRLPASAS